jgi:hypothetical protein
MGDPHGLGEGRVVVQARRIDVSEGRGQVA